MAENRMGRDTLRGWDLLSKGQRDEGVVLCAGLYRVEVDHSSHKLIFNCCLWWGQ